jgi:iron complex transport system substrate-binding protein
MRIVSLLPSATEIAYALGLGDDVVGVTHECDWPPAAAAVRVVSTSSLPPAATPAEVDRLVSASIGGGEPIYRLDHSAIRELQPDVVLTQDLCAVCAVPAGHVTEALSLLGSPAEVVSLDPGSLGEVLGCLLQVGRVTGTLPRAQAVVDGLKARLAAVAAAVAGLPRPWTFALEWSDPPFNAGHWVPEMIELAGGDSVLSSPGTPSVRVTWEQIAEADPQVVVFMPCGYGLEAAAREAEGLLARPELAGVTSLFAVDANACFSRPGPRLVDGVEILAAALHPEVCPAADVRRLVRVHRG